MAFIRTSRNLVLLLQGQFVTNFGNQIYDMAMLLWIKELTGSATIMGLAMLLTNFPETLLAPFGGKIADRFGKVRTMVVSDLVSGLAVGIVLLAIWSGGSPSVMILALCLTNLVLGMSAACFVPAVSALIPALVSKQKLEKGNAAHQFSRVGAQVIGQGIGGLVYSVLGAAGSFVLNALSFLVSAVTEIWIKVPQESPAPAGGRQGKSLLMQTGEMLSHIWHQPDLRALLVYIAAFHLCLSCLPVSLPFYSEHILHISDKWFGFFIAAYTIGIMLGFIISGALKPSSNRLRLIAAISLMVGLLFGVAAMTSAIEIAWVVLLGIGIGIGMIIVNLMTEVQLKSPKTERGGIMGACHAVGSSSFPLGMALTGILLDTLHRQGISYAISTRAVLALSATACVLVAITTLCRIRRMQ
jgi:MFS family permease